MPNEATIARMMDIFTKVIDLGGVEEWTAIVPNLSVTDAAPTGLTGFVIVQDDRDGDNILAKTVPGVVYANNDKVNVLFVKGTEPIAFQQGSESSSSGIWGIVPSTSTDIFYDNGDVGIGKSVAPDATLEILDTAQAQLRLTHTEDTKFVNLTLDTNHDLTIKPSSTGQIILQPTTDSVDFFQVLDANGGTPTVNVDTLNGRFGIKTSAPEAEFHLIRDGSGSEFLLDKYGGAPTILGRRASGTEAVPTQVTSGQQIFGFGARPWFSDTAAFSALSLGNFRFNAAENITSTTKGTKFSIGTTPVGNNTVQTRFHITEAGDTGIGTTLPTAKLHIDQPSTTAAIPVALFDQADISEEMFEFVSTIGVGNAIEAVGAKTLTPTHFIKTTIPGGLTRYFAVGTIA